MPNRRSFLATTLQGSTLLALSPTIPGFLARTARAASPQKDGRVLVVVQLDGGNDGINTVVPFADEGYARNRSALRLEKGRLIKVDDKVGLHPSMGGAGKLLESGRLAIVPGVGYPNPNRSHFESMAIWQSARLEPEDRNGPGWLGLGLDGANGASDAAASSLFVGAGTVPIALRGRRSVATSLERLDDLTLDPGASAAKGLASHPSGDDLAAFVGRSTLDAYVASDRLAALAREKDSGARYPSSDLAGRLRTVARLLKGGHDARIYYTTQSGYDTHAGQSFPHANLLETLSEALRAFLDDLAAAKLAERVVVLCFSEFGRRVAENGSAGTDHGTSGPVLLAGPGVRPGLAGAYPSLTDLQDGDLKTTVDFRRVYATVLEGWLGLPGRTALGGAFDPLPLFKA
jgi:uncharacterized protein (DUF1501 family)